MCEAERPAVSKVGVPAGRKGGHLTPHRTYTVETLKEALNRAVRNGGANAHQLFRRSSSLMDLLVPPIGDAAKVPAEDRALAAEGIIRRAIEDISEHDGPRAEALLIILALEHAPRTRYTLQDRRRKAAELLRVTTDTYRKNYEPELLLSMAFAIWKTLRKIEQEQGETPSLRNLDLCARQNH